MKKILSICMCLLLCVGIFAGCNKGDNVIRVNEVTHSVFYAPFYAAINKGYFAEVDIEIELSQGTGSNTSMNSLLANSADVILAGPETAV